MKGNDGLDVDALWRSHLRGGPPVEIHRCFSVRADVSSQVWHIAARVA
jgi:hypothetical protein